MKEGWTNKTLGEVCKIYNGNSINADYKKKHFLGATGGLPFIATKDVSSLGTLDYNNGVRIPNYEEYKIAPANSVFICAEGGSAGKKFAYVEKEVCFGNKLFCITPKDKSLTGKFVYHFVQSDNFRGQFFSLLTGLIGGVSAKKFQSIEIPVPPLSEQQRIVDYLDSAFAKIDAMKANAEKALNEAKAFFQASLKEMLEPKEGWEEKKLKDLGQTQTGTTPSKSDKANYGDYMEFIRPSEIDYDGNGGIDYNSEMKLSKQGASNGRIFASNSIFMVCIGATIGKVGFSTKKVSCNQQINVFTPKDEIKYKFAYYAMKSPLFQHRVIKEGSSSQATLPIINKGKWENLSISFPETKEQELIVSHLDNLSSKITELKTNFEKISQECDALKQAILRQVFE